MSKKTSNYRWVILAVISFAIFVPNYAQYQLSPIAGDVMTSYKLTAGEFTSVYTAPMTLAIIFSLLSGVISDKMGVRQVLIAGFIVSAAGLCWRVYTNSYMPLYLSMILAGCGAAFLNANSGKIIGSWFPAEKVGTMMGIYLAFSTLAMAVGIGTTAMLPGIHTVFVITAVLGVAAAIVCILFMKNTPSEKPQQDVPGVSVTESLKVVVRNRSIWIMAFCLVGIMVNTVLLTSFLPTALTAEGTDSVTAGLFSSIMTIGSLCGAIFMPVLAGTLGSNKPLMIGACVVGCIGSCFSWLAPVGPVLGICLFITGFCISGLMPLLMSLPVQLPGIGPKYAGTAGGFTSTLQLLGAVVLPTYVFVPLAGGNFNTLFIYAGGAMIVVAVLAFFLPDTAKMAVQAAQAQNQTISRSETI